MGKTAGLKILIQPRTGSRQFFAEVDETFIEWEMYFHLDYIRTLQRSIQYTNLEAFSTDRPGLHVGYPEPTSDNKPDRTGLQAGYSAVLNPGCKYGNRQIQQWPAIPGSY